MKPKRIPITATLLASALAIAASVLAKQPGDDETRTVKVRAHGATVAELRVLKHARLQISGPKLTTRKSPNGAVTTIAGTGGVTFRMTLGPDTDIRIQADEVEVTGPVATTDFR